MKTILILAGLATVAAMPAMATDRPVANPPVAAPTASASAPATKKVRYCVVETITGSHIPRKQCQTRAEWLALGFDPLAR